MAATLESVAADRQLAAARTLVCKGETAFVRIYDDDGSIEVATVRDGNVERSRVAADGTTIRLETTRAPLARTIGRRGMVGSWLTFFAAMCLTGAIDPAGRHSHPLLVALMLACVVAMFVSGALMVKTDKRVADAFAEGGGWFAVVSLSPPTRERSWSSVRQLLAAERLAARHGDHAALRFRGDGDAEVVVETNAALEQYVVDPGGHVTLLHTGPSERRWPKGELHTRARRRYGGDRRDWIHLDRRPDD